MVLRNQVEWALHCCSVLSWLPEGQYLATKDLAEFHGVPKEYLSKALQALAQAKLVDTTLGPTGGYRLNRHPKDISFLDIVEAVEGKTTTFNCTEIRQNNPCSTAKIKGTCEIASVMYNADEAWREVLRATSLETLAKQLEQKLPQSQFVKTKEWFESRR
jgi:Rrf2 family protein